MNTSLHQSVRTRRLVLGLSQHEVARRSGIQQRQVSLFERGGDVTLSTLVKLAQALDLEVMSVAREDRAKLESLLHAQRGVMPAAASPSLLLRYQLRDDEPQDEAQSNG